MKSMVKTKTRLTQQDLLVYRIMELAKEASGCEDKQVVAVGVVPGGFNIRINQQTDDCDGKCCHGGTCAIHAEDLLVDSGDWDLYETVYVNLFPCENCQEILHKAHIDEVYVFGSQHKKDTGLIDIVLLPDVHKTLLEFNGLDKQFDVAMGEMAELTTEICNSRRKDKRDSAIGSEIVDVQLQMGILDDGTLIEQRLYKYNKLAEKFCK